MSAAQAAWAFAESKVGCGYIYGATGWVCSQTRRQQQAAQYPEYADTILGRLGARWDGIQCFDCAQLTRQAVAAAGGQLPSGATSQWQSAAWHSQGAIDGLPQGQVLLLYRQADGRMQHTGLYGGQGAAIDARGTAAGVVRAALSSYPWTHWALPRIFIHNNGEGITMETNATVTTQQGNLNLRATPPDGKIIARIPQGARIQVASVQAHGGQPWGQADYLADGARLSGWVSMAYVQRDAAPGDAPQDAGIDIEAARQHYAALGRALGVQ